MLADGVMTPSPLLSDVTEPSGTSGMPFNVTVTPDCAPLKCTWGRGLLVYAWSAGESMLKAASAFAAPTSITRALVDIANTDRVLRGKVKGIRVSGGVGEPTWFRVGGNRRRHGRPAREAWRAPLHPEFSTGGSPT